MQKNKEKKPLPVKLHVKTEGKSEKVFDSGVNEPLLCKTEDGKTMVFKPFSMCSVSNPEKMKKEDMIFEICASHIMKEVRVPTLIYREGICVINGKKRRGTVSHLKKIRNLAQDKNILRKMKNHDEAVRGMIFDAWIGNFDRIFTNSNIWVSEEGKFIFGDYGCAFRKGLTVFGLPKANLVFMNLYGKKEVIEGAIKEIVHFEDDYITGLVDKSLKHTTLATEEIREHITSVLISNRDELKKDNPFKHFYEGKDPEIKLNEEEASEIAMSLIEKYTSKKNNPSFIVKKIIKNNFFSKERKMKVVKDILEVSLHHILDSCLKGKASGTFIPLENPAIFKALREPAIMEILKKWFYKDLRYIIYKLFTPLLTDPNPPQAAKF